MNNGLLPFKNVVKLILFCQFRKEKATLVSGFCCIMECGSMLMLSLLLQLPVIDKILAD